VLPVLVSALLAVPDTDVMLRASLDRTSAYPGQPVVYTLTAVSRAHPTGLAMKSMPLFNGFVSDGAAAPTSAELRDETLHGVHYFAATVHQRKLYPIAPGAVTISGAEATVDTSLRSVVRRSSPVTLEVKPLPKSAEGLAVGRWQLSIEVPQRTGAPGSPLAMRVVVTGEGDVTRVRPPPLEVPGARLFSPKLTTSPGLQVQAYVVTVDEPRTVVVPALTLRYFDPWLERIEETRTEPVTLELVGEPSRSAAVAGPAPRRAALASLRHSAAFSAAGAPLWSRPWFTPLAAGPLALGASLVFAGAVRRRGSRSPRPKDASARHLAAAAGLAGAEFWAELDRALRSAIDARLGEPTTGWSRDQLSARLRATKHDAGLLLAALAAIDAGRYAPATNGAEARKDALERVRRALET